MGRLLVMLQDNKAQKERDQEAIRITRLLLKRTYKKMDNQEALGGNDWSQADYLIRNNISSRSHK